jgi:hypothetical protein
LETNALVLSRDARCAFITNLSIIVENPAFMFGRIAANSRPTPRLKSGAKPPWQKATPSAHRDPPPLRFGAA